MNEVLSPVAQVEEDVFSSGFESVCHCLEAIERHRWCANTAHVIAAVVLEHIDAPASKALRIVDFVVQRSCYSLLAPDMKI
jgi:hypothetical protein